MCGNISILLLAGNILIMLMVGYVLILLMDVDHIILLRLLAHHWVLEIGDSQAYSLVERFCRCAYIEMVGTCISSYTMIRKFKDLMNLLQLPIMCFIWTAHPFVYPSIRTNSPLLFSFSLLIV
jgi:hypothetical protein